MTDKNRVEINQVPSDSKCLKLGLIKSHKYTHIKYNFYIQLGSFQYFDSLLFGLYQIWERSELTISTLQVDTRDRPAPQITYVPQIYLSLYLDIFIFIFRYVPQENLEVMKHTAILHPSTEVN